MLFVAPSLSLLVVGNPVTYACRVRCLSLVTSVNPLEVSVRKAATWLFGSLSLPAQPLGSSPSPVQNARQEAYQMRQMSSLAANRTAAADLKEWLREGGGGGGGREVPGTSSSPCHPSNGTAAGGEDRLGQKRKMEEARAGIKFMLLVGNDLGTPFRTCSINSLKVCAGSHSKIL